MSMKKNTANNFKTKDFYLAAFLLAKGYELLDADRSFPQEIIFIFGDQPKREKLIQEYLYGKAEVDARKLINQIRNLKEIIHEGK